MRKGWCPVHDRVFESAGGSCPECGTTLVEVELQHPADEGMVVVPESEDEHEITVRGSESEAPAGGSMPIGPATLATVVTAVVVVAFLAGLAFPRGRGSSPAAGRTPQARADRTVGAVRVGAGVRLRLDRFVQRGKRITVRVTVPATEPIAIGRIQSLDVTPITGREGSQTVNLLARTTVSGFVAEGDAVESPTVPVTGIHFENLYLSAKDGADLRVDLSGVSPVSRSQEPRAKAQHSSGRTSDGRTFRLDGVVGWADRLEARVRVSGGRHEWSYEDMFALVTRDGETFKGEEQLAQVEPGGDILHFLFFTKLGRSSRDATMRVTVQGVSINGGWGWDFS